MKKLLIAINVIGLLLITINHSLTAEATGPAEINEVSQLESIAPGETVHLQGRSGLIALAEFVNRGSGLETSGVTYNLLPDTNNTLDGSGLEPIGYMNHPDAPDWAFAFRGNFVGSGVVIQNLNVTPFESNTLTYNGVGLFGYTRNASIAHVTISGITIEASGNSKVGGLIGYTTSSTISGISITGNVNITGAAGVGSLIGDSFSSIISHSFLNTSAITISGVSLLGGLVGQNDGSISNSVISSDSMLINGTESAIGGFVGVVVHSRSISNSFLSVANLSVSGVNYVGGFVGQNLGFISSSFSATSTINITGSTNTGMLIGAQTGSGSSSGIYYNSGLSDGEWIQYNDSSGIGLNTIIGTSLLEIIDGSGAYELSNNASLPLLKRLDNQTTRVIPWLSLVEDLSDIDNNIDNLNTFYLQGRSGLVALAAFVNRGSGVATLGVTFTLLPDADNTIDGSGLKPIGHGTNASKAFQGVFDGAGVTIENLNVTPYDDSDGVGLFGYTRNAGITNVTIRGVTIHAASQGYVGSLVGYAVGTAISGVNVFGSIVIDNGGQFIGGFAGRLIGANLIINVDIFLDYLTINGNNALGGFVGENNQGTINNSYLSMKNLLINGTFLLGGFVGHNAQGTITNSYLSVKNDLVLTGDTGQLGGFVGLNGGLPSKKGTISKSYLSVDELTINGTSELGGFVGANLFDGEISDSFLATSEITISPAGAFRPFVGAKASNSSITDSFYNSGLDGNAWVNYTEDTASKISAVTGTTLLNLINGSGAFELTSPYHFPQLSGVSTPSTLLYWSVIESLTDLDTAVSQTDVINISNRSGLYALRDFVFRGSGTEGLTFALTNDIDLSGEEWLPIGSYGYDENGEVDIAPFDATGFQGVFDGRGFAIEHMTITDSGDLEGLGSTGYQDIGLFGIISSGAQILNVTLKEPTIDIASDSGIFNVGSLVGIITDFQNVVISGIDVIDPIISLEVRVDSEGISAVGGLVGYITSEVTDSLIKIHNTKVQYSSGLSRFDLSATGNSQGISNVGGFIGSVDTYEFQTNETELEFTSTSGFSVVIPNGDLIGVSLGIGNSIGPDIIIQDLHVDVANSLVQLEADDIEAFGGLVGGESLNMGPSVDSFQLKGGSLMLSSGSIVSIAAADRFINSSLGIGSMFVTTASIDDVAVTVIDSEVEVDTPKLRSFGLLYGDLISLAQLSILRPTVNIESGFVTLVIPEEIDSLGLVGGSAFSVTMNDLIFHVDNSSVNVVSSGVTTQEAEAIGLVLGRFTSSKLNHALFTETNSLLSLELLAVDIGVGSVIGMAQSSTITDSVFQQASPLILNVSGFDTYIGGVVGLAEGGSFQNVLVDIHLDVQTMNNLTLGGWSGDIADELNPVAGLYFEGFLEENQNFQGQPELDSGLLDVLEEQLFLVTNQFDQVVFQIEVQGDEEIPFSLFTNSIEETLIDPIYERQLEDIFFLTMAKLWAATAVDEATLIENLELVSGISITEFSGLTDASNIAIDVLFFTAYNETLIEDLNTNNINDFLDLLYDGDESLPSLVKLLLDGADNDNQFDLDELEEFSEALRAYFESRLEEDLLTIDDFEPNNSGFQEYMETLKEVFFPPRSMTNVVFVPILHNVDPEALTFSASGVTTMTGENVSVYQDIIDLTFGEDVPSSSDIFGSGFEFVEYLPFNFDSLGAMIAEQQFFSAPFVASSNSSTMPKLANKDYTPSSLANTPQSTLTTNFQTSGLIRFVNGAPELELLNESDLTTFENVEGERETQFEQVIRIDLADVEPSNVNNGDPYVYEYILYYYSGLALVKEAVAIQVNYDISSTPSESETPPAPSGGIPLTRFLNLQVTPLQQTLEAGDTWVPPVVVAEEVFGFVRTDRSSNVRIQGTVTASQVGVYDVVYTLSQQDLTSVSRTVRVTVVDTTPPVVDVPASLSFLQGETIEVPFTTSDNADGRLTTSWDAEWPTELGMHLRTLKVTDAAGNVTEATVEIILRVPRVVPVTVRVNDQSVVLVLNEQEINVDDYVIEVSTAAADSDPSTLQWQPYQPNLTVPLGEVVYVSITDATDARVVREMILPVLSEVEATPITAPVVPPSEGLSTTAIVVQSIALISSLSAIGWLSWTTFGKKPL